MSKSHKKEIDELTKAHHLSTIALKTKLEKEKEQALSNREHSYQEQQSKQKFNASPRNYVSFQYYSKRGTSQSSKMP